MNIKYRCIECNRESPPDFFRLKCEESDYSCFDIFYEKKEHLSEIHLPVGSEDVIKLGEGNTPCISLKDNFPKINDLICKLEYFSPTSSFKDRGSSILISAAKKNGVLEFAEDSSGNAGASMSAYASHAGIKAHIFAPEITPSSKTDQIKMFGAELHKIPGPRQNSTEAVKKFCKETAIPYVSHNYNPFFIEGMKSFAYEIYEEYGELVSDIVIPVGNGSLTVGAFKGFNELKVAGKIKKIPKLHCVQVKGFSPISNKSNNIDWEFDTSSSTLAGGIAVSDPPRINQVIQCIIESEASAIVVDEEDILNWHKKIAKLGILSEITSAAVFAGVESLINMNKINEESVVLVPVTGSGLKDLSNVMI